MFQIWCFWHLFSGITDNSYISGYTTWAKWRYYWGCQGDYWEECFITLSIYRIAEAHKKFVLYLYILSPYVADSFSMFQGPYTIWLLRYIISVLYISFLLISDFWLSVYSTSISSGVSQRLSVSWTWSPFSLLAHWTCYGKTAQESANLRMMWRHETTYWHNKSEILGHREPWSLPLLYQ